MKYEPKMYWENLLNNKPDLRGVGLAASTISYNKWLYKARERSLSYVIDYHNISIDGKKVLDVGCGIGYWVNFFNTRGADVTGIDITETAVNICKSNWPLLSFMIADIGLPFDMDHKFDIINIFDVLYHIVDLGKFEMAIKNIAGYIRENGWIVITDLFSDNDVKIGPTVFARSLNTYKSILEKNNLQIVGLMPVFGVLFRNTNVKALKYFWCGRFRLLSQIWGPIGYAIDGILMKLLPHHYFNDFILVARPSMSTPFSPQMLKRDFEKCLKNYYHSLYKRVYENLEELLRKMGK